MGAAAITAGAVIAKVPDASIVPIVLVLGCVLMMFFMMMGMGTGGKGSTEDPSGHSDGHGPAPEADKATEREQAEHRSA